MKIHTKYQGLLEVNNEEVIHFENGIPGFFDEKQFVVLVFYEGTPFFILQSIMTPELAFVMSDPFFFYKDYDFTLADTVVEQLDIQSEEEVAIYVLLTLQDPFEQSTANLQAPLVINSRIRKGKQVVLDNHSYETKHLLFAPNSFTEQEG